MSSEQSRQFIDEAIQAIQNSQFQAAVTLLDRAIALSPSNSEAFVLKGVALSQLHQNEEANESFRSAISFDPSNAKAFYNYAVHCFSVNDKERALEMAREALRIDSNHIQARELATRIEHELGIAPSTEVPSPTVSPPAQPPQANAAYARPGYYDHGAHSLRSIERLGKGWDAICWVLSAATMVLVIVNAVLTAPILDRALSRPTETNFDRLGSLFSGPYPTLSVATDCLMFLLLLWMIFDLSDRRGNWLWLLPTLLSCCCFMMWLITPIYVLFGRNR